MTALNVKDFRGMVPRISERLLKGNYATVALNCKLTAGCIDPLRGLQLTHTSLAESIGTMYRYRNGALDYWLVWPGEVDVARSPTAQDMRNRLYFTGDGEPRMTSYEDAIDGAGPYPAAWYVLGVYIPTVAATIGVTGGAGAIETRAYVYTFVTPYGEESAPSAATLISGFTSATSWDLSAMEALPPNDGLVTGAVTLSPGVVEVTLDSVRGLAVYEQVTFASVLGMDELNATFTIDAVDSATNKVQVALNTAQIYTSGGGWARRAPHNTTGMVRRIYRTVGTNADYRYVGETAATSFTDNIPSTALAEVLPTLDSYTPPKNGHSLVALANGSHAMLAGNELCFSEMGKPHSWPIGNRYAFAGKGIAQVAAANSVVVLTDGAPVIATATVPEGASLAKMEDIVAPALGKRGVVDTGSGALYPSHDGLWLATPSGAQNITANLYTYEEWRLLRPDSFKAAFINQCYYAMHDTTGAASQILMLDLRQPDSVLQIDDQVDALCANAYDGRLYVAKGKKVYLWDSDDNNRYMSSWKSAIFQLGAPTNFSCAQVHANYGDIVPVNLTIEAANLALLASADNIEGALGSTAFTAVPLGASNLLEQVHQTLNRVQFAMLEAGQIVFSRDLTSSKPFRLPGGFKAELVSLQITASTRMYSITLAQGMNELKQVSQG